MDQKPQEEIDHQRTLLLTHRRTLGNYLRQLALTSSVNASPGLLHGITEARQNIARIKATLRGWNVSVQDSPDDDADLTEQEESRLISPGSSNMPHTANVTIESNIKKAIKEFTCSFCYSQIGYDILFADYSVYRGFYGDIISGIAIAVLRCRSCQMYSTYNFNVLEEDYVPIESKEDLEELLHNNPRIISASVSPDWITYIQPIGQYPFGKNFPKDIPQEITSILQEAGNCLSVQAINAMAVMCRRAVEKLATQSGVNIKQVPLTRILEDLKSQELIDNALFEALTEIRYWGNKSAHTASDDEVLDLDQAQEMFNLVVHAIEYAYSKSRLISRTNKLRQRRNNTN